MAILCAMVFRLFGLDFSQLPYFQKEEISPSITTETGQDVRFSSSSALYSPVFVETPPPAADISVENTLPAFSDAQVIDITYSSTVQPDIPALLSSPLQWNLRQETPTVLILHTHTTESYTKGSHRYVETAAYRTLDEDYNMLAIGELTAKLLNQQGIPTLQDRQFHDYPSYNGSYSDARKGISAYLSEYPSIQLVLDLHRDAAEESGKQLHTAVQTENGSAAQLMVVIGSNHKGYTDNLSLALKLHAQLEQQTPGITRPLQIRASRFNQDLCPGALLVEVGAAGNSFEEALQAARQLAKAIVALAEGTAGKAR